MPAVTVEDILVLPRISEPDPATAEDRPVLSVTTAPSAFEGEGFPVRRAFAGVELRALDPFIHMDQMGEVDYAPGEPKGTTWHPHRGFETVTYVRDGIVSAMAQAKTMPTVARHSTGHGTTEFSFPQPSHVSAMMNTIWDR